MCNKAMCTVYATTGYFASHLTNTRDSNDGARSTIASCQVDADAVSSYTNDSYEPREEVHQVISHEDTPRHKVTYDRVQQGTSSTGRRQTAGCQIKQQEHKELRQSSRVQPVTQRSYPIDLRRPRGATIGEWTFVRLVRRDATQSTLRESTSVSEHASRQSIEEYIRQMQFSLPWTDSTQKQTSVHSSTSANDSPQIPFPVRSS